MENGLQAGGQKEEAGRSGGAFGNDPDVRFWCHGPGQWPWR